MWVPTVFILILLRGWVARIYKLSKIGCVPKSLKNPWLSLTQEHLLDIKPIKHKLTEIRHLM